MKQIWGALLMSSNTASPPNNCRIHNIAQIIKQVMLSMTEAKQGALYINSKLATQMQLILAEMCHPQLPVPIQTNNSTAYEVVTNKIIPTPPKIDMQFHWLCN